MYRATHNATSSAPQIPVPLLRSIALYSPNYHVRANTAEEEEAGLHSCPPILSCLSGGIVANCDGLAQLLLMAGESPVKNRPKMAMQLPPLIPL
jgi:hypothetical protein